MCLKIASRHISVHLHSAVVTSQARHTEVPFGFDRDTRPTAPCGQPAKGWLSAWICRTFPSQVTCGVMVAVLKILVMLTMLPLLAFPKGFLSHSTSFKIRLTLFNTCSSPEFMSYCESCVIILGVHTTFTR